MMNLLRVFCFITLLFLSTLHAQGIVNGDFELGRNNGWTEYSAGNYTLIGTADFFASGSITPPVTPRSGQYMGRLGGYNYEVNSLSQTVTLPNTTPLYLKFYYQDRNDVGSACDALWGGQIRVYIAGQLLLDTYICYYYQHETWTEGYFDVSAAAGQTVEIKFQADAAHSSWSFLYLDDFSFTNTTDVQSEDGPIPTNFELKQNYPNPFNPSTTIGFSLPTSSFVNLTIVDLLGRQVASVLSENLPAGTFNTTWDATGFPSGVYVARLQAGSLIATKKLVLLR
jgi:hypothetical protein